MCIALSYIAGHRDREDMTAILVATYPNLGGPSRLRKCGLERSFDLISHAIQRLKGHGVILHGTKDALQPLPEFFDQSIRGGVVALILGVWRELFCHARLIEEH